MTSKRISDQIDTIRAAAKKVSRSPEAALAFLRNAGIVTEVDESSVELYIKSATANSEGGKYYRPDGGAISSNSGTAKPARSRAHYIAKKSK